MTANPAKESGDVLGEAVGFSIHGVEVGIVAMGEPVFDTDGGKTEQCDTERLRRASCIRRVSVW